LRFKNAHAGNQSRGVTDGALFLTRHIVWCVALNIRNFERFTQIIVRSGYAGYLRRLNTSTRWTCLVTLYNGNERSLRLL
jgi:hypothetical protein